MLIQLDFMTVLSQWPLLATGVAWTLGLTAIATVLGTLLGVVLITLVSNVLIMVGIPSTWQTAILGLFIVSAGVFFVLQRR